MDSHPLIPPHYDSLQASESLSLQEGKWFNKKGERVWRAGTLVYTKKQLLALFFWLYIGQFTFWMQQMAIPVLFPLLLAKKGFSAGQIGTLWSVLPLGALLIFPVLGVLSDRTRTRFGRRRPYDLLTAPFWFIGFAILPFTHSYFQAMAAMVLVGFASAASNILNAFYNDVVPSELMGRFVGGMRFLGAVGALAFQLMLMPIFDSHPELIFLGIAGIGFVGEMLMLIMVKEGEYPPPPNKKPILEVLGEVVKEGFANRYIIFLWLAMGVTAFGGPVMGTYFNLFFTDAKTGLGLSTSQLGQLMSLGTAIGLLLIIPSGWCVDRFGPKRIWCWTGIGVGLLQISIYFVEKNLFNIYFIYTLFAILNTVMGAALLPLMYAYIPKDKFGQLSGSNAIVTSVLQIAGMNMLGWLVTFSGNQYGPLFMFGGMAYLLTPLLIYLLSRQPYPYGDLKTSMNPEGTLSLKKQ
jgi:maltose/moltooligosaccharide transporter